MALPILTLLEVAAILVFGRVVYQIVYNIFFSPLRRFPGPLLYTATSIPYDIACARGDAVTVLDRLHAQYGPVVRTRPTELSYIDGHVWKDVYGFRSGKEEWFKGDVIHYLNGVPGIISAPKDAHRRYRRSLAHAFSSQGLQEQAPRIRTHVDRLVGALGKHSEEEAGQSVDMGPWLSWVTTDIIGDLAIGESFGSLVNQKENEYSALTTKILRPAVVIGIVTRWHMTLLAPLLYPRDLLLGLMSTSKDLRDKLRKRLSYSEARGDFFDRMLKHGLIVEDKADFQDTKDGQEGVTFEELESNAQDMVFAGSETTATLLTSTIYFLVRNPAVLAKVTQLVRSTYRRDDDMTVASTSPAALPYLDAVLQESIRIHDPVPIFAPRVAPRGGDTVDGVSIPEGTRVFCAKYVAHRSALNFARPHDFVPERWLSDKPAEFANDNRHGVFQPFSFGPRNCIGMNLAKAEMHLILAKLLWHFDFARPVGAAGDGGEWDSWPTGQKVMFLWIKPPMKVSIQKRKDLEAKNVA
ncbi:cytochrome P450 ClCP1 [Apiospora saccharicola]|uniref:Cytochrome P450 ClCP1 n=1 Tax=Apiospora saccharicola TaxID=335842 RepID=A0ABR1W0K2_9PEZI